MPMMHHAEIALKVQQAVRKVKANWFPAVQLPLSERQALSRQTSLVKTPLWVSQVQSPPLNNQSLQHIFLQAIADMGNGIKDLSLDVACPNKAEWNGYRRSKIQIGAELTDREQFKNLMHNSLCQTTILYVHGGGYILGCPAASRNIALSLTQSTGGRVCSVDYRLSPQHPFPAALYDVLIAYLCLLYPPPGSFHKPIHASSIVLAGDSCGGTLCLALVQLLLHLKRKKIDVLPFHDESVLLAMPAGVATLSAYCDHTDALPSYAGTKNIDYLGQPPIYLSPNFPSCSIWPASPPRAVAYCNGSALCHPLVSPAIAENWTGSPPMWFACGEESVIDGCKSIARQAVQQGVQVVWEEYPGMPHIFPMLQGLGQLPQVKRCLAQWAEFCSKCVGQSSSSLVSRGVRIGYDGLGEQKLDFKEFFEVDFDEVKRRMAKKMAEIEESFRDRQSNLAKL